MAYGIVLVFEGVSETQYWDVNQRLGISRDGSGDWPAGMITHAGGPHGTNGWVVSEIWESKAAHEKFMADRLGAALAGAAVPAPAQVIDSELINIFQAK